jgi:hypothetical protein
MHVVALVALGTHGELVSQVASVRLVLQFAVVRFQGVHGALGVSAVIAVGTFLTFKHVVGVAHIPALNDAIARAILTLFHKGVSVNCLSFDRF